MKKFIIIIFMLAVSLTAKDGARQLIKFHGITPDTYVSDYHKYVKIVCEKMEFERPKDFKNIEKYFHVKNICGYIVTCSKIRYSNYALKCYMNKKDVIECLKSSNVIANCLEAK